jgi:hypothetical protein
VCVCVCVSVSVVLVGDVLVCVYVCGCVGKRWCSIRAFG